MTRRRFFRSLSGSLAVFSFDQLVAGIPLPFRFVNVAREAGLNARNVYGGVGRNRFLLETTGCGAAFIDFDNDGWLDIFLVNGTNFESEFPGGVTPVSRLYRNNRDGTFTDVTVRSGIARTGWGQAVCAGDYDNDGFDDLFVTYWGECALFHNNGDGTFTDVAHGAGVSTRTLDGFRRHNSGCAFLDYDRDGRLDLFVANYIDFDPTARPDADGDARPCRYKNMNVACGPIGLRSGANLLFHNNGNGTFTDVSARSGILNTGGKYAMGVLVSDFDNDGWPDIYVSSDSSACMFYRNNHDGTFTDAAVEAGVAYSGDGKGQAGMGLAAADVDGDGWLDIIKTNFAGDTSTLYANLGDGSFEDRTVAAGLGRNTRYLGWGAAFADLDNDGWPDIFLVNGHAYPEIRETELEAGYRQPKIVYRNLGKGKFEDVSSQAGPGVAGRVSARGAAFGDFDNDGDIDVLVNCVNDLPQLLRCDSASRNHWLKVKLVGTKSNRSAIGARVYCTAGGRRQFDEVRSGGSYYSQNDLRLHFGLGAATAADLEIRWPSGLVERKKGVAADRVVKLVEGETGD